MILALYCISQIMSTFSKLFMLGRVPYAKKKLDESVNDSRRFDDAFRMISATGSGGADLKHV